MKHSGGKKKSKKDKKKTKTNNLERRSAAFGAVQQVGAARTPGAASGAVQHCRSWTAAPHRLRGPAREPKNNI